MVSRELFGAAALLAFAVGCGADPAADGGAQALPQGGAGSAGSAMIDVTNAVGGGGRGSIDTGNPATVSAAAKLIKVPVDIILVLDNSGSMEDELDAVEKNINVNFANILQQSGVDYRVILISRQRKAARTESEEASTSICVNSPL